MDELIARNNTPLQRMDPMTKNLIMPYTYLKELPGNNQKIRIRFIKAFNQLYFHIDNEVLIQEMNEIIDIFHDCSLIIDDVEDSSDYRRGSVTSHVKFGNPITINCVSYMYFVAIDRANKLASLYTNEVSVQDKLSLRINRVIIDEMINLHHGQGVDIYWRDNRQQIPSEDAYLAMAMDKTSGLFRMIVKLLDVFQASTSSSFIELANLIGIIYQLRDDYLNLESDKYSHMKGVIGEDLIEGKFSFPILHSLHYSQQSPVYELLYNYTLPQRKCQHQMIKDAIHYMRTQSKSLTYTHKVINQYIEKARAIICNDDVTQDHNKSFILAILDELAIDSARSN